jgi:hypothetical protein
MSPSRGLRSPLLAGALSLLALLAPAAASARFPANPLRQVWCARLAGDSICRWRGQVVVAERAVGIMAAETLLPLHQSRLLGAEGSRVLTGPNATARLLFRNRARCSLGGNGQSGDYFAYPGSEVLFRQFLGYSSCTTLRGAPDGEAGILCSSEERCPGTMRWDGTYLIKTEPPEATASLTDTYVRRARIVVCSGSIEVRTEGENGFSRASGQAGFNSRWLIVVEEVTSTTYQEGIGSNTTGTSHSISISVSQQQRGRGPCASSSVEEQEHNVTP